MDKDDLENRIKILEKQLSSQNESNAIIQKRLLARIEDLKVACADAIECNFTARKFIVEHCEFSNHREFIAAEILIMSDRLRQVIKGKF